MRPHNALAEPAVDRRSERRGDAEWLAGRLADPKSLLTVVWRERSLVIDAHGDRAPEPGTVPVTAASALVEQTEELVYLGDAAGRSYFSIDLSDRDDPLSGALRGAGRLVELRQVGSAMSGPDGNLLAYARAMATWHRRHRFCGQCGGATSSRNAGHLRRLHRLRRRALPSHGPRRDHAGAHVERRRRFVPARPPGHLAARDVLGPGWLRRTW